MFAIVTIAGKQYKVTQGETITVDRLEGSEGDTVSFDQVLLVDDHGKVNVGTPTVKGMVVKAKVVSHIKGEKVHVRRFKSKVRYRKNIGFRPFQTTLEILSIGSS